VIVGPGKKIPLLFSGGGRSEKQGPLLGHHFDYSWFRLPWQGKKLQKKGYGDKFFAGSRAGQAAK
jgi:hypothetical protein